jgi:hypothetical protein
MTPYDKLASEKRILASRWPKSRSWQIVCYSLIHAKLRQFLRKLAGGSGWFRIPLLNETCCLGFKVAQVVAGVLLLSRKSNLRPTDCYRWYNVAGKDFR